MRLAAVLLLVFFIAEDCRTSRQKTGWKRIAAELGIGVGTLYRLAREGSKIREEVF
jgi:hypothetical protein